jgi:hypothetical protein
VLLFVLRPHLADPMVVFQQEARGELAAAPRAFELFMTPLAIHVQTPLKGPTLAIR